MTVDVIRPLSLSLWISEIFDELQQHLEARTGAGEDEKVWVVGCECDSGRGRLCSG